MSRLYFINNLLKQHFEIGFVDTIYIALIKVKYMRLYVATTFRDFNDGDNSKIQDLFLSGLMNQTHEDFVLVITIFRELNVEKHIKSNYPNLNVVFHKSNLLDGRFSLSEVFINGLSEAHKVNESILLWTTCDVVFGNDFFKQILNNYQPNIVGTSHPHKLYSDIEAYESGVISTKSSPEFGIDMLYFDSSLFKSENSKQMINNFKFVDWGIFEHYLVAISTIISKKRINLYNLIQISKILNNRIENNENDEYFINSFQRNKVIFDSFLYFYGSSRKFYSLYFCNKQFTLLGSKVDYMIEFRGFYFHHFLIRFPKIILLRIMRIMSRFVKVSN